MVPKYWAWNNGENGRPFIRHRERADGSVTSHNTKRHQCLTPESSLTSLRKRFVEVRQKAKSEKKSVNAPWKSQNFRDSEVWHLSN